MPNSQLHSIRDVINQGLCIGCGACTLVDPEIKIVFNQYGDKIAALPTLITSDTLNQARELCPIIATKNESEIAASVFDSKHVDGLKVVGHYQSLRMGHSNEFRTNGSSGGMATLVLAELLRANKIDYVLAVGRTEREIAEFKLITTIEELKSNGTSFYYPVTLEAAFKIIKTTPGRYAITGVPCFHKAIRLAKENDATIAERVVYQIGIVCGQMKSAHFAEFLARKAGKADTQPLAAALFRGKENTTTADNYRFTGSWVNKEKTKQQVNILAKDIGVNWAMSYFKPKACDFCDDVFAECADVAIMDAWLPSEINDPGGTSLIVTRDHSLEAIWQEQADKCVFKPVNLQQVIQSQDAGLRHRRDGLRFRLALATLLGQSVPKKRVNGSFSVGFFSGLEYLFRILLRIASRKAFVLQLRHGAGLQLFNLCMTPLLMLYKIHGKFRRLFASHPSQPRNEID